MGKGRETRVPNASYTRKHAPKWDAAMSRVKYTDEQCTWNYAYIHSTVRKSEWYS